MERERTKVRMTKKIVLNRDKKGGTLTEKMEVSG